MSKEIADLEAVEGLINEREAIEVKIELAKQAFVQAHCPYKVGDVMANDLEWCFRRMDKQIKITSIRLRPKRGIEGIDIKYSWHISAVVLKKDGTESQNTVSGTKQLTFKNRSM